MIKTVRELIKALEEFNPDALVFVGDNLNNHVSLMWGGYDDCTKENCQDVGITSENEKNNEIIDIWVK